MRRVVAFVFVLGLACPAQSQSLQADASTREAPEKHGFLGFARDLGWNFRNLPSVATGLILGVGGGLAATAHLEDAEITRHWPGSAPLEAIFEPGAVMGGGWVQVGGAVGTYVWGRTIGGARTAPLGADLVRGQIVNAVLTEGIKVATDRQRPDGGHFSFPSGHTSSTFTTATVLQHDFGWKVGVPAYAAAAFVGGSRLQENRHYLSDVVFGAAIGIASGRAATVGHGSHAFALSPLVEPRAIGIMLTRRGLPVHLAQMKGQDQAAPARPRE